MNRLLAQAIEENGAKKIAAACGVTYQAVNKWADRGFPRTEWSGETNYTQAIEDLTGGKYTKADLLEADPKGSAAVAVG